MEDLNIKIRNNDIIWKHLPTAHCVCFLVRLKGCLANFKLILELHQFQKELLYYVRQASEGYHSVYDLGVDKRKLTAVSVELTIGGYMPTEK